MRMIKAGIAKTVSANKVAEYKAKGWAEIKEPKGKGKKEA